MNSETSVSTVSAMYDQFSGSLMDMLGGSIHVGYWDERGDELDIEAATNLLTTKVADRLGIKGPEKRALDVGCGTGKPAIQISSDYGLHVTGITISKKQVEVAQEKVQSGVQPADVDIQLADAMDLPFPDNSFDGAWAIESLCHMHDRRKALEDIFRVLCPGARLVIADMLLDVESGPPEGPDVELLGRICEIFQLAGSMPTADDYRNLLQEAGFEVLDITNVRENVWRTSEILATRLRQLEEPHDDETAHQLRAVAAELSRVKDLPQSAYALITAVRGA